MMVPKVIGFVLAILACQPVPNITASAFLSTSPHQHHHHDLRKSTKIFGISEWRDLPVEADLIPPLARRRIDDPIIRRLPVLLTSSNQVALQGETKYFQWTKDDDVRLFQQSVDVYEGIFGLGFVRRTQGTEEEILLDKIALMEIEDYNMMGQEFGIFCSAKVVGRASILQSEVNGEPEDPLTVLCTEIFDRNEIVSLEEASFMARTIKDLVTEVSEAECPKSYVMDFEDLDDLKVTRLDRFWAAYEAALAADNQGYHVSSYDNVDEESPLSWNEINAISWAAFATSDCLKQDEPYRLSALDIELVSNRLKFAIFWLSDILIETMA